MTRTFILQQIANELRKSALRGPVAEIRIIALQRMAKSRSIFLAESTREALAEKVHLIREYLDNNFGGQYLCTDAWHNSIDEMIADVQPGTDPSAVDNNWRCRLVRPEQLALDSDANIRSNALSAIWRVFVLSDAVSFFVRHDIFPAIWYPGFSVAGFPNFTDGLRSALSTISHQGGVLVDRNFDSIKLFVKGAESRHYTQLGPGIAATELLNSFEATKAEFNRLATAYFSTVQGTPGAAAPSAAGIQNEQQRTVQVGGGAHHAIQNVGGTQIIRAACPGDPKDYFYNPVTNAWVLKPRL